jgi:hypothetical protein
MKSRNIFLLFFLFFFLPALVWSKMNYSLETFSDSSIIIGNSVIEIVYDGKYVWIATGDGLSGTADGGNSWKNLDNKNGLNSSNISALAAQYTGQDTTLWMASSYTKLIDNVLIPFGNGFNKTKDFGLTWNSFTPFQATSPGMLAYDLAVVDSSIWAACFYGGLIVSNDQGENWQNVFVDSVAKDDFEQQYFEDYRNRFFSVTGDTPTFGAKKIAYDGKYVWVTSDYGIKGTSDGGTSWISFNRNKGLNTNDISALGVQFSPLDTILWVAAYHNEFVSESLTVPMGDGFNKTKNFGSAWDTLLPGQATFPRMLAYDFAFADTSIWAACFYGGLIVSKDQGNSWQNVFVDSLAKNDFDSNLFLDPRNHFKSVTVDTPFDSTIIWAGNEAGIYKFIYTTADTFDTVIAYNDTLLGVSGNYIAVLGIQKYSDRKIIWAATHPIFSGSHAVVKSTDNGNSWTKLLQDEVVFSFDFDDSIVWAATQSGLKRSSDGGTNWENFDYNRINLSADNKIHSSEFYSVKIVNNTIWAANKEGFLKSTDDGGTWQVFRSFDSKAIWAGTAAGIFKFIYTTPDNLDTVINYNDTLPGILGNFIVALAIQKYSDKKIIWAATHPTFSGSYAVSKSTDNGDSWVSLLQDEVVWNFDFDDSIVWVATQSGLKRSYDGGANWENFDFNRINSSSTGENKIYSSEFFSVRIVDDPVEGKTIWAGNSDGLLKSTDAGISWKVFRSYVTIGEKGSETAYAYPTPFSPLLSTGVTRIHYKPQTDGTATIKLYDFAMNLVTTLIDGKNVSAEVEYDEAWNGKNDKGDLVANGVYFFEVKIGNQKEWGKVVVIK